MAVLHVRRVQIGLQLRVGRVLCVWRMFFSRQEFSTEPWLCSSSRRRYLLLDHGTRSRSDFDRISVLSGRCSNYKPTPCPLLVIVGEADQHELDSKRIE